MSKRGVSIIFLLFLLPRLAWEYHTDTFALICT
jgi:hypothetical protein